MAATLKVDTITNASNAGTANLTLDAFGNATVGNTLAMGSSFKRNRIINGDMRVAQRGTSALTVNSGSDFYAVDRFYASGEATDGVFTVQQSSTAPDNFVNSLIATVTTNDSSIGATQRYFISQNIEGLNTSDLGFGQSWAKTVTVSFWVRSSVTGTFGGCIYGASATRFYPFSYTIIAANTWEQKTVTIAGDTTGAWLTTNATGIAVLFSLGCGSSRKGTVNTWTSSVVFAPTGSVDLISTNGATFYITGVQLEVGSVATPYERQIYSDQLAQCQRYCPVISYDGGANAYFGAGMAFGTTAAYYTVSLPVTPRVPPTGLTVSAAGHFAGFLASTATSNATAVVYGGANNHSVFVNLTGMAGLAGGNATLIFMNSTAAKMIFTGCEL